MMVFKQRKGKRGRIKKTWFETIIYDSKTCDLTEETGRLGWRDRIYVARL